VRCWALASPAASVSAAQQTTAKNRSSLTDLIQDRPPRSKSALIPSPGEPFHYLGRRSACLRTQHTNRIAARRCATKSRRESPPPSRALEVPIGITIGCDHYSDFRHNPALVRCERRRLAVPSDG
jgi:hypothetical protein